MSGSTIKRWINIADNKSARVNISINKNLSGNYGNQLNKINEGNNDVIEIIDEDDLVEKDPLEMSNSNNDLLTVDKDPLQVSTSKNNNALKADYTTSAVKILSPVPPPPIRNIKLQPLPGNCLFLPSSTRTYPAANKKKVVIANTSGLIKGYTPQAPSTATSPQVSKTQPALHRNQQENSMKSVCKPNDDGKIMYVKTTSGKYIKTIVKRVLEKKPESQKVEPNFRKKLIVPLQKLPINNEKERILYKDIQIVKKTLPMQQLEVDQSPQINSVNCPIKSTTTTKTIVKNESLTIENDTNLTNVNTNVAKASDFDHIDLTATNDVVTSLNRHSFNILPKIVGSKPIKISMDSSYVLKPIAVKKSQSVQTTDDFVPFELDQEALSLVETLKIYNLQLTCRICFTSNDLVDIFDTKHENLKLYQILHELTNQKCSATGPRFVCQSCMDLIIQAYKFKTMFKRASIIAENVVARNMSVKKDEEGIVFKPVTQTNIETFAVPPSIGSTYSTAMVNSHLRGDKEYLSLANCLLCDFSWTRSLITVIRHYTDAHGVKLSFNMQTGECLACNVKMERLKLPQHFNSEEHKSQNLMCYLCFDSYPTKRLLKLHLSRNHDVSGKIKELSKDYPCILCKVTFDTFKEIDDHFDDCHPNASHCIICNAAPNENYLKHHMLMHLPYGSRFCCRICRISFECFKDLQEHNQSVDHTFCNECKIDLKTPKVFVRHMRRHQENQSICEQCGFISSSKDTFFRHLKCHSDQMYYCEKCPAKFSNQSSLHTHQRRHELVCPICNKSFEAEWKLILHKARHDVPTAVICPVRECNKTFPSEAELATHLPENHEALTCTTCNEKFYTQSNLTGHTAIHLWESTPETDNPNKCKLCKKLFNSEMHKLSHIRSNHQIYFCNVCPKMFSDNLKLKSHQVQVHDLSIDPQWRVNRRKRHRNMYFRESEADFEVVRKRERNNEEYEEMVEENKEFNKEYEEMNKEYGEIDNEYEVIDEEYEELNEEYEELNEEYDEMDEECEEYEENDGKKDVLKEFYENQAEEFVVEDAGEGPSILYY